MSSLLKPSATALSNLRRITYHHRAPTGKDDSSALWLTVTGEFRRSLKSNWGGLT